MCGVNKYLQMQWKDRDELSLCLYLSPDLETCTSEVYLSLTFVFFIHT